MKKIFTIMLAFGTLLVLNPLNAQTLKEKMQAKIDALDKKIAAKGNAGSYSPSFSADLPQDKAVEVWKEGAYGYFQKKEGQWVETNKTNVTFLKDTDGGIQTVKLGSGEYVLKGKNDGFGKYYYYESFKLGLIMDSSIMVIFKPYNYSIVASVGEHLAHTGDSTGQKVEKYVENAESIINQNKTAFAEKKSAERKAKYSLEGKSVSKVEIVNLTAGKNGKIGCYSYVSYDIKATLKNGTVISTADGGFKSDYEITFNNAKLEAGKIKAAIFDKDVFSVDVKVKSDPSKTAHKEIVIPYNQAISFNWSGTGWSRSRGESARNIRIELKQTKHTETGADLLMVKIKGVDGTVLSAFKISPDMNIIVKLLGGYGGTDDGTVFPGGNGGTITVVKDPNVKYYSLDAKVNGGRGGKNGAGRTAASGLDGKVVEETRPVKF